MRPSYDSYFLALAVVASKMATCARRQVGCVITDKNRFVLSTGFNGPPKHFPHCDLESSFCQGAKYPSGEGLSFCEAIHAEINALLQCKDSMAIKTLYCTTEPCRDCTKAILNTGCERVVFLENYAHGDSSELWERAKGNSRDWVHYNRETFVKETGTFLNVTRV